MLLLCLSLLGLSPMDLSPLGGPTLADWAPLLPTATAVEDDVQIWLTRLSAAESWEREKAQRWLGIHLRRAHFPELAAILPEGGVEIRRRVTEALAGNDAHLGLAALMATDSEPAVKNTGVAAMREMLVRWSPSWDVKTSNRLTLPAAWLEDITRPIAFDPRAGSLSERTDLLSRAGRGPARLVLDPALDPLLRHQIPELRGIPGWLSAPWPLLLQQFCQVHSVAFEIMGWAESGGELVPGARPFVRICKRGDESEGSARAHIVRWCVGSLDAFDSNRRVAHSRALGSLGWPAGLRWLEERWFLDKDEAALRGLLVAAGRGWVAPGLASPAAVTRSLQLADDALERNSIGAVRLAEAVARALAATGPTGIDGEYLARTLLSNWDSLSPGSRWIRLVALEGAGLGNAEAQRRAAALLAGEAGPALRLQALRALVAIDAGGAQARLSAGSPAELLNYASTLPGVLEECAEHLSALGVTFPAGEWWRSLADGDESRVALLAWSLHGGARAVALELLEQMCKTATGIDLAADHLRRWAGRGSDAIVRGLLAGAGRSPRNSNAAGLRRLALRAGRLADEEERGELDRILALAVLAPNDLADLGALCASAKLGWRARAHLLDLLAGETPVDPLGSALERAMNCMRRERQDEAADQFVASLRRRSAQVSHPLSLRLFSGEDWPPPANVDPLEPHRANRQLPANGL